MTVPDRFETVQLPPTISDADAVTDVRCSPSMVIIGANGAGKTRIGTWLEVKGPQKSRAHRIPAQRSLRFPKSASPIGMEAATNGFQFGERPSNWSESDWDANKFGMRLNARYGNVDADSVATAPIADFDKLLVLMFSENYTGLIKFDAENESSKDKVASPVSTLKKVKRVWESILTHRTIEYQSGEVRVKPKELDAGSYLATGMSDGERVVFYLVGQCLCAPAGSLIIIDEPELHLHRSVQRRLWDAIEDERPDCQFIYITHDLAFAEERAGATKIWLKSSTNDTFDWLALSPVEGIPEDLYLEVLGSRQPVIFSEGNYESIDFDVYSAVYQNYLIRPVGSCAIVVQATKAFRNVSSVHHLECFGIVDRDYLTTGQLASFERSGVGSPMVAEIENMFLLPEVLEIMAEKLEVGATEVEKVYAHVLSEFERKLDVHALALAKRDIELALTRFGSKQNSVTELEANFHELVSNINVSELYNSYIAQGRELISAKDYLGVLKVFNNKDLVVRVTSFFGLTKPSYLERARSMARKKDERIVQALACYLPRLSDLY
jgi:energy-coupling factor transporter ATP-binding protein EcfA2